MRKIVLMNGKELINCIDRLCNITLCTGTTAQLFDEVHKPTKVKENDGEEYGCVGRRENTPHQ